MPPQVEKQFERIAWSAHEYSFKEKTADWFWAVVIIILSIAAIAFIYDNTVFAIFLILAGAALLLQSKRPPKKFQFELSAKGVKIGQTLYPYSKLKAFWIEEEPFSHPKLLLQAERFGTPIIVIFIETDVVDVDDVRKFLDQYIPEEKIIEPLSQRFMEYLGF